MGTCAGLGHPVADKCLCGLLNANSQGFTIDLREWSQAQYAAMGNMQAQTFGGVAIEVLQARGISILGGLGQANLYTPHRDMSVRAQIKRAIVHSETCELCDAKTHGVVLTKASDGSMHWVDMCHDCGRAVGGFR